MAEQRVLPPGACPLEPLSLAAFFRDEALERRSSEQLAAYLDAVAPLEDRAGQHRRELVLETLSSLMREWLREVAAERGIDDEEQARGRLMCSGSYRLALNAPDGDVDTCCIVPPFVGRDDFFGSFVEKLRACGDVERVRPIAGAMVPIIELVVSGVDVDVGFARAREFLPAYAPDGLPASADAYRGTVLDTGVLKGGDKQDMFALNGPRVTETIRLLVESAGPATFESFTTVVRTLRLWAKRRGIYSNKMGFLGGVNFNILGAFVCLQFPNLPPAALVERFFDLFQGQDPEHCADCQRYHFFSAMPRGAPCSPCGRHWSWWALDEQNKVVPRPISLLTKGESKTDYGFDDEVWDGNSRDSVRPLRRSDVMPILTPAYPSSNSSVAVCRSTLKTMVRELRRGAEITAAIIANPDASRHDWGRLFAPSDFFVRFDNYLELELRAASDEDLDVWASWVDSRVIRLVRMLEHPDYGLPFSFNTPQGQVCPWPKAESKVDFEERLVADDFVEPVVGQVLADPYPSPAQSNSGESAVGDCRAGTAISGGGSGGVDESSAHNEVLEGSIAPPGLSVAPPLSRLSSSAPSFLPSLVAPSPTAAFESKLEPDHTRAEVVSLRSRNQEQPKGAKVEVESVEAADRPSSRSDGWVPAVVSAELLPTPSEFDGPLAQAPSLQLQRPHSPHEARLGTPEPASSSFSAFSSASSSSSSEAASAGPHEASQHLLQRKVRVEVKKRSFYIGLKEDPDAKKQTRAKLRELLKAFFETSHFTTNVLYNWADKKEGMKVRVQVPAWRDLPDSVFPEGREIAAIQRARVKEEEAQKAEEEARAAAAAKQSLTYVKGQAAAPPVENSAAAPTSLATAALAAAFGCVLGNTQASSLVAPTEVSAAQPSGAFVSNPLSSSSSSSSSSLPGLAAVVGGQKRAADADAGAVAPALKKAAVGEGIAPPVASVAAPVVVVAATTKKFKVALKK